MMLAWLKTMVATGAEHARSLYGSIVTQARAPDFYAAWGVPDTVQGRFEMIVAASCPGARRLARRRARAGERLARALTEAFIVDMDDSMREMTFGDLAVPREIKRAAAALFDRHSAYLAALEARRATAAQRKPRTRNWPILAPARVGCGAVWRTICAQARQRA